MAQDFSAICFLTVSLPPIIKQDKCNDKTMKKIFLLIAAAGLLMGFISCSDDDGPRKGGSSFTVNTPMINHMYNTLTGEVMAIPERKMPAFKAGKTLRDSVK